MSEEVTNDLPPSNNSVQERVKGLTKLMADASAATSVERDDYPYGRNVSYDLTGSDTRFANKYLLVVFQQHQVHTFQVPVHKSSIKITNRDTGEVYKEDPTGRTVGSWRVTETAVDTMAVAYRMDASFDGVFVKSIEINLLSETATDKVNVDVEVQQAFRGLYELHGFDGVGPTYTPALGRYFLEKLDELEAVVTSNVASVFASTDSVHDLLEEDLTGTNPKNYVEFESHTVNTSSGVDSLMPGRGSFYSHDFKMWKYEMRTGTVQMSNKMYNISNRAIFLYEDTSFVGSTTSRITTTKRVYLDNDNYDKYIGMAGRFIDRAKLVPLVAGIDYELVHVNVAKTEKSSSQYGVYDTIRLLSAYTGPVLISYHAFGGEVVMSDVRDLRQDIINAVSVLTSKRLLTADVFDKQPVIKSLIDRIQAMEQYHNHFNRVEHAIHMNNPGFHWFNIASLYDVAWGAEESVVDEIGTFRVESKNLNWCYEFAVGIDLRKKLVDMLRCKTIMTNDVHTSDLSNYVAYAKGRDDLAIRVCWVGDGKASGVVLQLGWNFDRYSSVNNENGVSTDTVIVTNKSGVTSKWKLAYSPMDNTYTSPTDIKVYNHVSYVLTSDVSFQAGKDYYKFEPIYAYYKTADARVRENVEYFTKDADGSYISVELTVGETIENYTNGVLKSLNDVDCTGGIFERSVSMKVPKIVVNTGAPIYESDEIFEIKSGYDDDVQVQMPNSNVLWIENATGCYSLARILEPSDGLIGWVGNVPLHSLNAQANSISCFISKTVQDIIDLSTIKGISFKLYDRKFDKIVNRSADIGYIEPEYVSVESGTKAQEGEVYYGRTGSGEQGNPYKYFVVKNLAVGATLVENQHFTCKVPAQIVGQVIFDLLDLCGASLKVTKGKVTGSIGFGMFAYVGTDSVINERFDIREIDLHF